MKRFLKLNYLNIITAILLLLLPYYLFNGKLYVGGDDTRLLYVYPFNFFKNVAFFSWYNVSSIGMNVPNQFSLPFLTVWSILIQFIPRVQLDYLSFSLPLILGLVYFQKFIKALFKLGSKNDWELYIGSLFFILSPIIIINQLFIFLVTIWLLGIVPALGYYFVNYLRKPEFSNLYKSMWLSFFLASAFLSVPWIMGFILPFFFGSLFLVTVSKKTTILKAIKRGTTFTAFILISHSFWILGFLTTYIELDKSSAAVKFTSSNFLSTFNTTVLGTAIGNIFYPVLNLFHRQIAVNFGWKLSNDFINFYDKTVILNLIFVGLILLGAIYYKSLDKQNRKLYVFILISFVFSLYFFTVNIGPLKDLFLQFGKIPGFVMFRNFYDKFAPGFAFIYSMLITVGLLIARKRFPNRFSLISALTILVIIINFIPVKSTVTSALWTTQNIGKTITFPTEYLNFMDEMGKKIPPTNSVISIPYGIASYTAVKDTTSDNVYLGLSPVRIFSGVNDISGDLSLSLTGSGENINQLILDRKYKELSAVLQKHNVNYLLVTKNIPSEVLHSYAFDYNSVKKQDAKFLDALAMERTMVSENGNYELYPLKQKNIIIESPLTSFEKINQVKYRIQVKNIKKDQILKFNDTYHPGWKIFPMTYNGEARCKPVFVLHGTTECAAPFRFVSLDELSYLWKKDLFQNSHKPFDNFSNEWTINSDEIKRLGSEYYKQNSDGSLDVSLLLYFRPQLYFYYGSLITLTVILLSTAYLLKIRHEN